MFTKNLGENDKTRYDGKKNDERRKNKKKKCKREEKDSFNQNKKGVEIQIPLLQSLHIDT